MEIERATVLTFVSEASFQSVGDGGVVLLADSGQLYSCNETTEAFLRNVDGKRSFEEIVAVFCDEFEIDEVTANSDLANLARNLIDEGILQSQ